MVTEHGKLTLGHIGFVYPSTQQQGGGAGIIIELVPGLETQAKSKLLDGNTRIHDYKSVGDAGEPKPCQGNAIVKQLRPEVAAADAHPDWPVKEVTSDGWALAQDPWIGRWHWLPARTEGGDHIYSFNADRSYQVAMQGLVLDGGPWEFANPATGA